jgi:hypothetical protein
MLPADLIITTIMDNINGNSYPKTNFISLDAPTEAKGLRELEAPIMIDMAGIIKRYKTAIKSPTKLSKGKRTVTPKMVDTKTALKSPKNGANRKVNFAAPCGIIVSLPNNFTTSTKF